MIQHFFRSRLSTALNAHGNKYQSPRALCTHTQTKPARVGVVLSRSELVELLVGAATCVGTCLGHVVVAVFTLNRPFYPASSAHPVSVLIPYPRNTDFVVTDCETEEDQKMKKIIAISSVKRVKCQRTGYDNTTTQVRPKK